MTTGRNDACPCGSDKKYKKCCLAKDDAARAAAQAAARDAAARDAATRDAAAAKTGETADSAATPAGTHGAKPPAPRPQRTKSTPVAPPLFRRRAV